MGGYGLLLAAHRGPVPTLPPAPDLVLPDEIADPERLPRMREVQPASFHQSRGDDSLAFVAVLVTGAMNPDAGEVQRGGVALLDGRSGALLAWRSLAEAQETPSGLRLQLGPVPEGDHIAAFAVSPDRARYSYRDRAFVSVAAGTEAPPPTLDARTQDVTVRAVLQGRPEDSLPPVFRLSRVDDPHWHPPISPGGLQEDPMTVPSRDGVLRLRGLGPGRYVLRPLEGEYRDFELTVPGPATVTATFRL